MATRRKGGNTVVSYPTLYPGPLGEAKVKLKNKGETTSTGSSHPLKEDAKPVQAMPPTYVAPGLGYVLVEEEDKRFRLVKTAAKGSVKLLKKKRGERAVVDNRSRVTNTSSWPWCVHGHIIITFPNKKQYIGSATMVNRHHAITAGHCVYSSADGGWAISVQFNAGQNDSTLPFGTAWATHLFSFKGWTDSQNRDYDTGMLILDRDLGNNTGWMGLIKTADSNLQGHTITVAGYPGDKGGQQLWEATAPVVGVGGRQIQYNAFTKGGDSGAGVFGVWPGVSLEHVCADHVAGANGIPNTGSRLSADKFDRIVDEWFPK